MAAGSREAAGASARRRARLRRGPLTIGEPAPAIDALLAAGDPYRPDTIADGGDAFGLRVRAASVRGLTKRYAGGPRQDDMCLRLHHPTRSLVVAVADGVSGAERSDVGAALAVRHAVAAVVRQLDAGAEAPDWEDVFGQAAWALVEEHRRATGEPQSGVDDAACALATTLLVAVVVPTAGATPDHPATPDDDATDGDATATVHLAAIGDSPALLLERGEFRALAGEGQLIGGLLGGGVRSLPRASGEPITATCTMRERSVLLLCTDGLALPLADGRGEVGLVLERELARPPDTVDFARLLDFSRATYDDDRTLVAVWARGDTSPTR